MGADNAECVAASDVVVVAVPWDGHRDLVESLAKDLAGKVVVDCVNPLGFDERGSARPRRRGGQRRAAGRSSLLPDSTVVAAFHHLSAVTLLDDDVAGGGRRRAGAR